MTMSRRIPTLAALVLSACLCLPAAATAVDRDVIIGFHKAPGAQEQGLISRRGGKFKKKFKRVKALTARISEQVLAELKMDPNVAYVEDDAPMHLIGPLPNDIERNNSWGVVRVGAEQALAQNIRGAGVKVAVIDSGIDYTHAELAANYKGGVDFITYDLESRDPMDENGHGTHVAGIIAAQPDGDGVFGIAPDAELYAVKVLDGGGFGSTSALIEGIEWAIENQMQVVNISMGGTTYTRALEEACNRAYDAGILLIAAAGNTFGEAVMYPAAFDSVIAVSGTSAEDAPGRFYSEQFAMYSDPFSSLGPQVELAGPGEAIYSTVPNGFDSLTGTSQASPHVAGVAALFLSAGGTDLNGDGVVNNRDIRLQLQQSALDLGEPGRDETFGYGLVSAAGLAGGPLEPEPADPAVHFTLSKDGWSPLAGAHLETLAGGQFEITIVNDSLRAVGVLVYESGALLREDSGLYRLARRGASELRLTLEATTRSLDVVFIPRGRQGTFADIFIQPLAGQ